MREDKREKKDCSSCGKPTKYICTDCLVDGDGFIPLCEKFECKDKHRLESCTISNPKQKE